MRLQNRGIPNHQPIIIYKTEKTSTSQQYTCSSCNPRVEKTTHILGVCKCLNHALDNSEM